MGTQGALGDLESLTQDAEPRGTTLVDACNGFNELSSLEIMGTVWHHWLAGARFALNCYRHWEQLLIHQPGEPSVTILIPLSQAVRQATDREGGVSPPG